MRVAPSMHREEAVRCFAKPSDRDGRAPFQDLSRWPVQGAVDRPENRITENAGDLSPKRHSNTRERNEPRSYKRKRRPERGPQRASRPLGCEGALMPC